MAEKDLGGRPTSVDPSDRLKIRKEYAALIEKWARKLEVGHNTIRRALVNDPKTPTKKGPSDSTAATP